MQRQHHPIADLFPMLAEDELRELAADIKQRGQLQPIMLDDQGRILDGRNRNAACELAGVEPWFEDYKGDDPDGYALSVNINRRHLLKGQRAMVTAQVLSFKNSQRDMAQRAGVSQHLIKQASVVLQYAPEQIGAVVAGPDAQNGTTLDKAYAVAKERKAEADTEAGQLDQLREMDPQLAVLVENKVRSLDDALEEAKLRAIVRKIDEARNADGAPAPTFAERAESGSITWDEAATLAQQWRAERADAIKRAQNGAIQIVNHWGVIQTLRDQAATPYVADILAGLGDSDRVAIDRIINELKG